VSVRNRTHGLFVQGGVRLDRLADIILTRYPNARLTENMVRLDLGVPEPERVVEPVTEAESATHFHLPKMEEFRGVSDKVDLLLDELAAHPDIKALRRSFERKRKKNVDAGSKAAQFEDDERNELQRLLAQDVPSPQALLQHARDRDTDRLRRAYEKACDLLVSLGHRPPTVD